MLKITQINSSMLQEWMDRDEVIIIDVREPLEYKNQSIPRAINIPLSKILVEIHKIKFDESKKIVLQCAAGIRSMYACEVLLQDGFEFSLYNLQDGIEGWKNLKRHQE